MVYGGILIYKFSRTCSQRFLKREGKQKKTFLIREKSKIKLIHLLSNECRFFSVFCRDFRDFLHLLLFQDFFFSQNKVFQNFCSLIFWYFTRVIPPKFCVMHKFFACCMCNTCHWEITSIEIQTGASAFWQYLVVFLHLALFHFSQPTNSLFKN